MAINIYDPVVNKASGETFQCITVTPEAYVMRWVVQPQGYVPFEHIHYRQDEAFHIVKGELKVVIEGKEHIARAGDSITVPKGARHTASNNRPKELEAIIEYIPALDHERFSQFFCGLIIDGHIDEKGSVSIPMMGYFLRRSRCKAIARPTSVPAAAFNLALNFFYIMGTLKGWNKLYKKYTGN